METFTIPRVALAQAFARITISSSSVHNHFSWGFVFLGFPPTCKHKKEPKQTTKAQKNFQLKFTNKKHTTLMQQTKQYQEQHHNSITLYSNIEPASFLRLLGFLFAYVS